LGPLSPSRADTWLVVGEISRQNGAKDYLDQSSNCQTGDSSIITEVWRSARARIRADEFRVRAYGRMIPKLGNIFDQVALCYSKTSAIRTRGDHLQNSNWGGFRIGENFEFFFLVENSSKNFVEFDKNVKNCRKSFYN